MTLFFCLVRSLSTFFKRFLNLSRYFVLVISAFIFSVSIRRFFNFFGISSLIIRCVRFLTMVVLSTSGLLISIGLFLVRRCSIWMVRRIFLLRLIIGSSLFCSVRSVRSMVYFFKVWRWFLVFWSFTFLFLRICLIVWVMLAVVVFVVFRMSVSVSRDLSVVRTNSFDEIKLLLRFCVSLS